VLRRGDGAVQGSYPVYHLAALSLAGEADQIGRYLADISPGAPYFMLPYVTQDMVQRALDIAEGRAVTRTPRR
jgi:hypothetical protein